MTPNITISIDIKPEVQAELTRQAAAHGIGLEPYAASLLEEATQAAGQANRLTKDRLNQTLKELAQFSHKIPLLPDGAFSRESLYPDED